MKTLRVFCTDPDATDSSSSEEDEKIPDKPTKSKRFLRELTIDTSQTLPENILSPPLEPPRKAVKRYPGVRQRPSGRYAAEIKHPITKVRLWLGTFNTAKQAYDVYCLKKLEFDALRNVEICGSDNVELKDKGFGTCNDGKNGDENGIVMESSLVPSKKEGEICEKLGVELKCKGLGTSDDGKNGDGNGIVMESSVVPSKWSLGENGDGKMGEKVGDDVMEVPKGVIRVESGKWGAMIENPKTRKRVWLGSFDSVEEAIRVYKKKESEFDERFDGRERKLSEILGGEGVCGVGNVKRRKVVSGGGNEGRVGHTELKNRVSVGMCNTRKPGQTVVKKKKVSIGKKIGFKERIERIKQLERVQCGCGGSTNVLQTNRVGNSSKEIVFALASPRAPKEDEIKKGESVNSEFVKTINDEKFREPLLPQCGSINTDGGEPIKEKTSNSKVIDSGKTGEIELPPGVTMTKSGRFGARVTDPISGTEIWLGSYYTIEKAVDSINRKMGRCEKFIKSNLKKGEIGFRPVVRMTKSGTYGAWVIHPDSGKKIWLGQYDTPKKARDRINRKTAEFEKSIKSNKVDCGVIHGSPTSVLVTENEISETSSIKVKTEVEYKSIHVSPTSVSERVGMRNRDVGEGKSLDLPLTFDEAVKLGFMNEYGQLLGEYCECDESMWLSNHDVD